jgi:hypothetical protein
VDFFCEQAGIAIEADGQQHDPPPDRDVQRDRLLTAAGILVLRCTNEQITHRTHVVLQVIRRALQVRCPDGPEVRQAMGALLLREKGSRGTGKTWGMRGESLVSAYQARSAGNSPTRLIPDPVREGPLPDSHRLTFVMRHLWALPGAEG